MTAPSTTPLLSIRGLGAAYGKIDALKGVDLEINSGEIVALIGANGAGKSTLMVTIFGKPRARAISSSTARLSHPFRRIRSRACGLRNRRRAGGFFRA